MCNHCDKLVERIADHHEIPQELAREMLLHAFKCEDDECEYVRIVTQHAMAMLGDDLPQQLQQITQIVTGAVETMGRQIKLDNDNGTPFSLERLQELAASAQGAIQAEIDLSINRPHQEGE